MSALYTAFPLVVVLAAAGLFLWSEKDRTARRRFTVVVALAVGFVGVGLGLLGLPGAALYEAARPVVQLALGARYRPLGDAAWPVALWFTMAWPASVVLAYAVAHGPLKRSGRGAHIAVMVLLPAAAAVAMAFFAHLS